MLAADRYSGQAGFALCRLLSLDLEAGSHVDAELGIRKKGRVDASLTHQSERFEPLDHVQEIKATLGTLLTGRRIYR